MIDIDKIYNEDCLQGMKRIADGAVDCIITDLPYGTTACAWDSVIPFEPLWEQFKRVTKPNAAIVLFGREPFSTAQRMSNIKDYRYDWIWVKSQGVNFVQVNKSKSPADVVKQANRLKKQLGAAIQGMDSYKSIKSYSDLAKAKVEADAWKGKSAQRIENALRIGKAMTKGSRGGYGMIPKS